jgi:hypothetical protein
MSTEATPHIVDVQAFIDAQQVSPLQKLRLFLCFLSASTASTRRLWDSSPRRYVPSGGCR